MIHIKTISYLAFTLVLLAACSGDVENDNTNETVIHHKINAVDEAKKSVEAINKKIMKTSAQAGLQGESKSGSSLYARKCASCHGHDAKKSALNASQAIAGWDTQRTQNALNGYKNGSFGGKMKGIMEGQSRPLSDTEVKLISNYISVL